MNAFGIIHLFFGTLLRCGRTRCGRSRCGRSRCGRTRCGMTRSGRTRSGRTSCFYFLSWKKSETKLFMLKCLCDMSNDNRITLSIAWVQPLSWQRLHPLCQLPKIQWNMGQIFSLSQTFVLRDWIFWITTHLCIIPSASWFDLSVNFSPLSPDILSF